MTAVRWAVSSQGGILTRELAVADWHDCTLQLARAEELLAVWLQCYPAPAPEADSAPAEAAAAVSRRPLPCIRLAVFRAQRKAKGNASPAKQVIPPAIMMLLKTAQPRG